MSKLTPESKWEVENTMSQANQLNARLLSHVVAHLGQIKLGATPSNVSSGPVAHPMAPPPFVREIN